MNIVKEHINFKRGLDPKVAMGTGVVAKWLNLKAGTRFKVKRPFGINTKNRLDDGAEYNTYDPQDNNHWLSLKEQPEIRDNGCIGIVVSQEKIDPNGAWSGSQYGFYMWGTPGEFEERLEIL